MKFQSKHVDLIHENVLHDYNYVYEKIDENQKLLLFNIKSQSVLYVQDWLSFFLVSNRKFEFCLDCYFSIDTGHGFPHADWSFLGNNFNI